MNLRPNAVKYLALSLFGVLGISSSAHAQVGPPEISFDPTLSFILTTDIFSKEQSSRFFGNAAANPRTIFTESDFRRSGYEEPLAYGPFEFKAEKWLSSGENGVKLTIDAHSADWGTGQDEMVVSVNLENSPGEPFSLTCHLSEEHTRYSRQLELLSFRGECDGRVVTFTLTVKLKTRADMEQKACIDEGVRLATALDSTKKRAEAAEKWTAEKNGAITLAQTNLATARTERDQARASLQTLTTNLNTSVLPYLKRVVETLKDPNNYYRALRNDAKGVLDSTSK